MASTRLYTTDARDQVPEVERQIKGIKERMRAHHANLTLPSFTRRMEIELSKHVLMLLNSFSPKIGLSRTHSPRINMTGKTLDWKNMCKQPFVAYAQMHEERKITNTLRERTQGAICLGTTGNAQRTYKLL